MLRVMLLLSLTYLPVVFRQRGKKSIISNDWNESFEERCASLSFARFFKAAECL